MEIKILNPEIKAGKISHALFDFDGTISLLRHGWEEVMQSLMEEMITGDINKVTSSMRQEIASYIDESTGILTIYQMRWLKDAVKRWQLNREVLSEKQYKKIYNERMLEKLEKRIVSHRSQDIKKRFMLTGSRDFLRELFRKGVKLYLASGTDDIYVRKEARVLEIEEYFNGRIYGALDDTEEYTKENIIRRIFREEIGREEEEIMIVVGDGPVEIKAAKEYGAVAVGVASNEQKGRGWNKRKMERLINAGADLLIPDFRGVKRLLQYIEP